jgi:phosphoserine phosphatase
MRHGGHILALSAVVVSTSSPSFSDRFLKNLTGLGFIVANLPGLMVGAYAGNRIGAIRDAKGKSVAAVFSQLGGTQKAEVRI